MHELNGYTESPDERITRWAVQYAQYLHNVLERYGVPGNEVSDLEQVVLLKAWRYLKHGETVGRAVFIEKAWLDKTAHNAAITYHRVRGSDDRRRNARAETGQWQTDRDPTVSEAIRNEKKEAVRKALSSLDPMCRRAVEACVLGEQTVTDWAGQVSIPRKTAERLRNRGLRMLREKLEDLVEDLLP